MAHTKSVKVNTAVIRYLVKMNDRWFAFDSGESLSFARRIGLATKAGIFIGLEREKMGKHVGLKTNTLVSIGSGVFVIISFRYGEWAGVDVTRVLSQVAVGIGFLGAGVILQKEHTI